MIDTSPTCLKFRYARKLSSDTSVEMALNFRVPALIVDEAFASLEQTL